MRAPFAFAAAVVLAAVMPGRARAETTYVATGSQLHYQVTRAPLPAAGIGAASVRTADRARGRSAEEPGVLGPADRGVPPASWPRALPDDAATGRTPLAASDRHGNCRGCGTVIGDDRRGRVAALYASSDFAVGDELAGMRLLVLRARYRDGMVAWINGREVARRNRPFELGPMQLATRPRGPEWESLYIPVTPGLLHPGDNQLTVEVRPSGRRLSPGLDLELVGRGGPRLVRGPMVQRVGVDRATIVFDTDLPARGAVEYGHGTALTRRAVSAGGGLAVHHLVELTGLAPGSAVDYRVIAGGDAAPPDRFHTAPTAAEPLRFAVYGDMRGGHQVHRRIVESVAREAPDLVVLTGDLVLRGGDEGDWQRFFDVAEPLLRQVPYYPAAGNHDMGRTGVERRRFGEIFALPPRPPDQPSWANWYSFDVAGVHFVMLDSNSYERPEQLSWLEKDLAAAHDARAIFVAVHNGPYSRGTHGGSAMARERYVPLLVHAGVTMLFSGHDHIYQRGEIGGLRYFVSGGGGASLYPIRCSTHHRHCHGIRDGAITARREHHYIMVTVEPTLVRVCPKRPDGTPLEACQTYSLRP